MRQLLAEKADKLLTAENETLMHIHSDYANALVGAGRLKLALDTYEKVGYQQSKRKYINTTQHTSTTLTLDTVIWFGV